MIFSTSGLVEAALNPTAIPSSFVSRAAATRTASPLATSTREETPLPSATPTQTRDETPSPSATSTQDKTPPTATGTGPDSYLGPFAIGLREVAAIEARMDAILKQLGRSEGPLAERIRKLRDDLRYPEPQSEASRAALMRDIDTHIADALERSRSLFDLQPRTLVIAQPFPRFREASASANYNRAPLDGSRPGIFQMPLRPERMTRFGLRTLVYHETVPGHHFQISLEQENTTLPRFRQSRALGGISALSEGWAFYAEALAAEVNTTPITVVVRTVSIFGITAPTNAASRS